jgi:hypothetical protein
VDRPITVLGSGFGLGFYIPALLLDYEFRQVGQPAEVVIFESFLVRNKQDQITSSRRDYHQNFAVALVAQRIPKDIRDSIDWEAVDALLDRWAREEREDFVVFSGHWIYILDLYRERRGAGRVRADILYVDAALSPSWKGTKKFLPDYPDRYSEKWMFDAENGVIHFRIPVNPRQPVLPYEGRPSRLVLHGGGWGMGTYLSKPAELEQQAYALDIVISEESEAGEPEAGRRYWMNDPGWEAWEKDPETGRPSFPRFGEVIRGEVPQFSHKPSHHLLYERIGAAKAIVSKPGGSTLIDSLASGTPVVFLEPFGPHEQQNAELWMRLGFGISWDDWKRAGFSEAALQPLHEALMKQRTTIPSYSETYWTPTNP